MSPFSPTFSATVGALGEERLIEGIRRWLGDVSPPAPLGIGDDCAILPATSRAQAITVDPVIHGRHFDDTVPPRAVGAKLLKRNLSDLAAMGAKPRAAVVALTLDARVSVAWLEAFYRGLAACARTYGVAIVGGDVAQAEGVLAASLTLIGESTGTRMLTRVGARVGDHLYVTGKLGGSRLGRHFRFTPRLAEGAWLAAQPEVRAMMDLSDGLAKDLHALTPKAAQPELTAAAIPIHPDARRSALATKKKPLHHALCDGEDYELVFVVAKKADGHAFERRWRRRFSTPLSRIGSFTRVGKIGSDAINLGDYHGYEHLRTSP